MEPVIGLRVVRGPDWEWEDQDGGEGFVGTVAVLEEGGGGVIVQWDMAQRCRYRCGSDNKFDLRILDPGPIPRSEVSGIDCDWCHEEGLVGYVWRCVRCLDYYLCSHCYNNDRHSTTHPFFRVPSCLEPKPRERVSSRLEGERVAVRGIFAGARVSRGHDWKWGNQDGGVSGLVLLVKGWHNGSKGSVVEVQWEGNRQRNVYRVGHKGKMDLVCLVPGEGGWYIPEHLPILGGSSREGNEGSEYEFAAGDTVRVDLDLESAKLMQEDHGGWVDAMNGCVRDVGEVIRVYDNGDVQVRYVNNSVFNFNPVVLIKVDIPFHVPGTVVRVMDDIARVAELQKIGPGWNDEIAMTLGVVGLVTKRNSNGEVQASVNGQRWLYHPQCLQQLPRHRRHEIPDVGDVDKIALVKVLTILQREDPREGIWYLAATGEVASLQTCIEKFPEDINKKLRGKTAIHVACTEGYLGCLKVLLSYQPDLEIIDDNGLRPIHVCAYSNFAEGARLLLEHGAEINSKDGRENTAAMAAGALGHFEILEVLLGHRLLNIHAGDHIGSTALHCAVIAKRFSAVKLLLEAGADPSIPNYTASTPLHDAASTGYLTSVERMVAYFPQHINLEKCDDGYTPLHSAVINNRVDVAHFLMAQPSCQLERRTSDKGFTALHLAASEGHTVLVELLVGYGAEVNVSVEDGSTLLMMVLTQKKIRPLGPDTPHLKQIDECLVAGYEHGSILEPYVFVACMLVQEGADPHIKNRLGESPLQKCRSDLSSVIRLFSQKQGVYRGSLRSKMSPIPTNLKRRCTVSAEAAVEPMTEEALPGFPKHLKEDTKPAVDPAPGASGGRTGERATTARERAGGSQRESTESGSSTGSGEGRTRDTASSAPAAHRQDSDGLCCLCDKEINAKLNPCGHSVMCKDCTGEAKRCPTCHERIQGSTPLH